MTTERNESAVVTPQGRRWGFWIGFAVATLLIAGVVSYFASSSPRRTRFGHPARLSGGRDRCGRAPHRRVHRAIGNRSRDVALTAGRLHPRRQGRDQRAGRDHRRRRRTGCRRRVALAIARSRGAKPPPTGG